MQKITEDWVLRAADMIRTKTKAKNKMASLDEAKSVMIRWDMSHSKYGESYASIEVTADDIRDIVHAKLKKIIHDNDVLSVEGDQ